MANAIATRQQIEAAATAARATAIKARASKLEQLKHLILVLAGDIREELEHFGGADGRIPAWQLPTLRAYLDGRLSSFSDRWRALLDDGLREAAKIGASLLELVGREGGDAQVIGQVVESIRAFTAADGLRLSDRLWRTDNRTREILRSAIEGAIARGESSFQAAQRFLREGLPLPDSISAGLAAAQTGAIRRAVLDSLTAKDAPGDPAYNLQRVLRTEINRAYTESYVATVAQHPDVVGVRFRLSPQHPKTDICDLYASANLHGLGAGVYPPGQHPYPAHPQTLSFLTTVFADQITAADRAGKQSAFDWLQEQSADEQDAVLGGMRKGAAFRAGQLEAGDLRMPWYHIAARLGLPDESAA
jgi:hypothetical protein